MPRSYAEATNKVFQERRFETDGSRDVSGIVEEVGPGPAAAGQFKKGDEVFAMADPTRDGAYADYIAIHGTALALNLSRSITLPNRGFVDSVTAARRVVAASRRARRFPSPLLQRSSANAAVPSRLSLCLRDMLTQPTKSFTKWVMRSDSRVMKTTTNAVSETTRASSRNAQREFRHDMLDFQCAVSGESFE